MEGGWTLGWFIQKEEEKVQRIAGVQMPGPGMERKGDAFGLKIDNARNALLIVLDVCSKLWSAAREGSDITSVLPSPAPSPCSSGRKLSVLAFREELPQAYSSGCPGKGEGHTSWQPRVKDSSGNTWSTGCFSGSPLKITDLSVWIRMKAGAAKRPAIDA